MPQSIKPGDVPVASDVDKEVKLLSGLAKVEPSEARMLIEKAGSFAEAARQLGIPLVVEPSTVRDAR